VDGRTLGSANGDSREDIALGDAASSGRGSLRSCGTDRPVLVGVRARPRIGRSDDIGWGDDVQTRLGVVAGAAACLLTTATACGLGTSQSRRTLQNASSSARSTTGSATAATRPASSSRAARPGCHENGDPRAGVNTPIRLHVRARCITVHGIVGCINVDKGDGDTHLGLLLDPGQAKYLTPGNAAWQCSSDQGSPTAPRLLLEIIPQHCIVRKDNCADRGHFTDPKTPANGAHVTVTGPWVQDTAHFHGYTMWSEIHPVWKIAVEG
jgi:hypothetical protein